MKKSFSRRIFLFFLFIVAAPFVAAWQIGTETIGPFPQKIERPSDLPLEDISFKDELGTTIRGWIVPGETGRGVVLVLHGLSVNRNILLKRIRFLHKAGYTVMAIDFQAHGESDGPFVTVGYRESYNAHAAMKLLRERYPHEKIGIVATSMGAASVLARGRAVPADAYVLESPFISLEQFTKNRLSEYIGSLSDYFAPLLLWQVPYRMGFDPDDLVPADGFETLSGPVLLVGARRDTYVTIPEIMKMYDSITVPKELWIIENMPHSDFSHTAGAEYEKRVLGFLSLHLRGESADAPDVDSQKVE